MAATQTIDGFMGQPGYAKRWADLERKAVKQLQTAKAQVSRIPKDYRKAYTVSAGEVERIRLTLADELKDVQAGKIAPSGKAVERLAGLFQDLEMSIRWIEKINARWAVVIDAGAFALITLLAGWSVNWIKGMPREMSACITEFIKLNKGLQRAGTNLANAQARRAVNVAIAALSLFLPPAGALTKAILTVAPMVVGGVDRMVAPGKSAQAAKAGSMVGDANTAVGSMVSAIDDTKKTWPKVAGAASALVSLEVDTRSVREAEKKFAALQVRIKRNVKRYERLHRTLQKQKPNLKKHQRTLREMAKVFAKIKGKLATLDSEAAALRRAF